MRWSRGAWPVTSHGVLQQPEHAAVQEGETGDGWSPRRAASSERGVRQTLVLVGVPRRLWKPRSVAWVVWAGLL